METQITLLDTVQICNECGKKIRKGKSAVRASGENIYFCDTTCLIKKSEETED